MEIEIQSVRKAYGLERRVQRTLDLDRCGLCEGGWACGMLRELAKSSERRAAYDSQVCNLVQGLESLSLALDWRAFANQPIAALDVSVVAEGFRTMEAHLSASSFPTSVQDRLSREIRTFGIKYFLAQSVPRIERIASYFRSSIPRTPPRPRQLIADEATGDEPPVAALSHSSITELRDKARERLELDFERISAACDRELSEFYRLATYCAWLRGQPSDEPPMEVVLRCSQRGYEVAPEEERQFRLASIQVLEIAYAKLLHPAARSKTREPRKWSTARSLELVSRLRQGAELTLPSSGNVPRMMQAAVLGTFSTVIAAFLVIKMRTGWNVGSVLELTEKDVERLEDGYQVQGFKSKTDDFTPHWTVGSSDQLASRALGFLLHRIKSMREIGWLGAGAAGLWLSPITGSNKTTTRYATWPHGIRDFCKRHGLPRFSAEQVRNQALAIESFKVGGLEASRRMAGHRHLKTTAQYVDQLLLQRLNSAVNLEFQRRLEASVEFRVRHGADAKLPTNDLLYSIGDGSSCTNPHTPPRSEMASGGVCRAQECHVEGGCPNRKVVVDTEKIEEIVRTLAFYERHWKRILTENPDLFRLCHMPKFMFAMALEGIIRRSPYRSYLVAAQEAMRGALA